MCSSSVNPIKLKAVIKCENIVFGIIEIRIHLTQPDAVGDGCQGP